MVRTGSLRGRVVRTPMETVDEDSFRCESASDHRAAWQPCTPRRGMPLPPKILVCAAIVKIRDEHRLRGSCATELLEAYRAYYPPSVMSSWAVTFGANW